MFSLCKYFDELSLEDDAGSSSSSSSSSSTNVVQPLSSSRSVVQALSYGNRGTLHRFLDSRTHSHFSQSIIEQLRAPFLELPRNLLDSSSFKSYDIRMGLGFSFLPGQSDILYFEFYQLPSSFYRLSFLSNSLGFSYNIRPLSAESLLSFSCSGAGLRGLVKEENICRGNYIL